MDYESPQERADFYWILWSKHHLHKHWNAWNDAMDEGNLDKTKYYWANNQIQMNRDYMTYIFRRPDGSEFEVNNLKQWCKDNNRVFNSYKGYVQDSRYDPDGNWIRQKGSKAKPPPPRPSWTVIDADGTSFVIYSIKNWAEEIGVKAAHVSVAIRKDNKVLDRYKIVRN